jgi:large subunit ribosomal protein L4
MKAPIYNLKAEKIGDFTLPKTVFDVEMNNDLIAAGVRSYLANRRSSHAKVKDRGEVSGTTKKMWAQKGTGRARHGSSKAGIFVGGGSVHGPQGNQNFTLKVNQKSKKLALNSLLTKFAKDLKILIVDDFKDLAPKTKEAWNFINLLEKDNQTLVNSNKIGIITGLAEPNVIRAFRNISGFSLLSLNSLNVYDLSNQNFLIFSQKAIETLK